MSHQERYIAAAHAMQSGVKADMETDPNRDSQGATTPKHLRVGVNTALSNVGSLAKLLIDKGIITEDEYFEAIADGMERERDRYRELITSRFGVDINLA